MKPDGPRVAMGCLTTVVVACVCLWVGLTDWKLGLAVFGTQAVITGIFR